MCTQISVGTNCVQTGRHSWKYSTSRKCTPDAVASTLVLDLTTIAMAKKPYDLFLLPPKHARPEYRPAEAAT